MTNRFSTDGLEAHGDPEPIDYDAEGFDGPTPGNVTDFPNKAPLFRAPITEPEAPPRPRVNKEYTGIINAAIDVLSARLLGLIAVLGAVAMFGYAVFDPIPWRTYTVVAYACVVLFPTIYLALKKG